MQPFNDAVMELRLVVHRAAQRLEANDPSDIEDQRTQAYAELMDAMDRLDPGLGTKLMSVLYGNVDRFGMVTQ